MRALTRSIGIVIYPSKQIAVTRQYLTVSRDVMYPVITRDSPMTVTDSPNTAIHDIWNCIPHKLSGLYLLGPLNVAR